MAAITLNSDLSLYTYQGAQANLGHILDRFDAQTLASVDLVKTAGGQVVAKLLPYATYAAADIAGSARVENIAQSLLQHGPMQPATNGLYKFTKATEDAVNVGDQSIHSVLTYLGLAADGFSVTANVGGASGDVYVLDVVDPGAPSQPLSVTYTALTHTVSVSLATDAGSVITSTYNSVVAAINASAASAVVTAAVVGNGGALDWGVLPFSGNLSGGGNPSLAGRFHTLAIYRKRAFAKNGSGSVPSTTPRAVIISKTHATFLGL